jgi:hypothetical protein
MVSFILVLFTLLSLCSCAAADVPTHPEATSRISALKSVAVLPAEVYLTRNSLGRSEELGDRDSQELAAQLGALVAQEFTRRGFQTIPADDINAAKQTGADGIVFVRLEGSANSRTRETTMWAALLLLGWNLPGGHFNDDPAVLNVTLLDGAGRDLLWSNDASRYVWSSDLSYLVTQVLEKFPSNASDDPRLKER